MQPLLPFAVRQQVAEQQEDLSDLSCRVAHIAKTPICLLRWYNVYCIFLDLSRHRNSSRKLKALDASIWANSKLEILLKSVISAVSKAESKMVLQLVRITFRGNGRRVDFSFDVIFHGYILSTPN